MKSLCELAFQYYIMHAIYIYKDESLGAKTVHLSDSYLVIRVIGVSEVQCFRAQWLISGTRFLISLHA